MIQNMTVTAEESAYAPSARSKLFILTDDTDAARAWSHVLTRYDIETRAADYSDISEATSRINSFDLSLVDHYQDADSALQICQRMRDATELPLILFTYETDERYHLKAYKLGVDECVTKPIGIPLFLAKTRAWLRRVSRQDDTAKELAVQGFRLDLTTRMVGTPEGKTVKLSNLECRLMHMLMANYGRILETSLLTDRIWSSSTAPDARMLKNLVYRLRCKLEVTPDHPGYIRSVPGIGYVFSVDG